MNVRMKVMCSRYFQFFQIQHCIHFFGFQRIAQSLRQGGPHDIQLERFVGALHDTSSGLTYSALSGVRKQSVQDVERLFSESLIKWMDNKDYLVEAKYLRVIRNWRRASDERGLTDEQRSQFNKELLSFILDDLMPWHKDENMCDFSLLEVNKYVCKNCCIMYMLLTTTMQEHQQYTRI